MKWFKHDSDANMDFKLQQILLDYGLEGYGLYWYCIELIVNKLDSDHVKFELEHDSRIIARNTGSTVQKVEEMMRRFVELKLFECIDSKITCLKIAKRLDKSMTSSYTMRALIGQIKSDSHDVVMTNPDGVMREEIRTEKKRNRGENPTGGRFVAPTLTEVTEYCTERKNGINPERFIDYYSANGWVQGKGKKIKDWKACVRTWERNTNEKTQREFSIDDLAE